MHNRYWEIGKKFSTEKGNKGEGRGKRKDMKRKQNSRKKYKQSFWKQEWAVVLKEEGIWKNESRKAIYSYKVSMMNEIIMHI